MTTSSTGIIAAALLALIVVPVIDEKAGKAAKEGRKLRPQEVLSWRYDGARVVVVTKDGQKYGADVPKELAAKLAAPEPQA